MPAPLNPPLVEAHGCQVSGCLRIHYAKTYCYRHYKRWRRAGDPGPVLPNNRPEQLCAVDTCLRVVSCKGMCATHYAQLSRKGNTKAIEPRSQMAYRDEHGRKWCSKCHQWKPVTTYSRSVGNSDGLTTYCRPCDSDMGLFAKYGITRDEFNAKLESQGSVCPICGRHQDTQTKAFAVDHNHECCAGTKTCGKCIRDLLCGDCNAGLGFFRDNVEAMTRGVAYLQKWSKNG